MRISSPRSPYTPTALAETSTLGGCRSLANASQRSMVPWARLSRIRRRRSLVQRPAAIGSPARCTTASMPSSWVASSRAAAGSHRMSWGPRLVSHQSSNPVPTGGQKRNQRIADEPSRSGDENCEGADPGMTLVSGEVGLKGGVSIAKGPFQLSADQSAARSPAAPKGKR